MINKGYLTCDTTTKGDECYTPYYAVEPLLEFISKDKVIWCPFDEEWSAFYNLFTEQGYKVIRSSLCDGHDFFTYEPNEHYDIIISNPPFSKKDDVLKRLYDLDKPFAMLLPLNSLQSKKRFEMFISGGVELLSFDSRIGYHDQKTFQKYASSNHYGSAYFCRNVLPDKLVLRKLHKYQRPLLEEVSDSENI